MRPDEENGSEPFFRKMAPSHFPQADLPLFQ
jgi:hypothetical protein